MMVSFESAPVLLLLLVLLPAATAFLLWRERARSGLLARIGERGLTQRLFPHDSRKRRQWKSILWGLALASVVVALAHPVWGLEMEVIETEGVAVLVVLDISNSMNAEDVLPSRLERAKLSLRDLYEGLVGNEVGLIVFAGSPIVQFPLTNDIRSAVNFLNAASSVGVTMQGTGLESALKLAVQTLTDNSATTRMIVLVSDGEYHEGDPLRVAEEAARLGIAIHALGYGDPAGAPIALRDNDGNVLGEKTDSAGNVVITRLDETTLQAIAQLTGGIYQRASASGAEITNLLSRIWEMQAGLLENRRETRGVERFGVFVACALLILSFEMLLPETRGRQDETSRLTP